MSQMELLAQPKCSGCTGQLNLVLNLILFLHYHLLVMFIFLGGSVESPHELICAHAQCN